MKKNWISGSVSDDRNFEKHKFLGQTDVYSKLSCDVSPASLRRAALLNYFSLFSSFSTLICCALPSVLVLLGMGTTVASLLSAAPWLVSLSRHKIWTFSIAGVLIAMSFVMTYLIAPHLQQGEVCDSDDPTTCGEVSKISRVVLWGSAAIWSCGFFVAYLLGPILERIDR